MLALAAAAVATVYFSECVSSLSSVSVLYDSSSSLPESVYGENFLAKSFEFGVPDSLVQERQKLRPFSDAEKVRKVFPHPKHSSWVSPATLKRSYA